MQISIFNYECPNQYLRDTWLSKRAFNKNFTLRAWSSKLGISSAGNFHQIIEGKRSLPKKYIKPIAESLNLETKEVMFLETLVEFSKAKTLEHKSYYKERLEALSPQKRLSFYEIEAFHILKNPLYGAIIELTCVNDFNNDPLWIKERLTIQTTVTEIEKAIKLLLELKLLINNQGLLKRSNEHIYTKQDLKNEALQAYHKNVLALGAEQISKQGVDTREYNATAFGIKKSNIPKIKKQIREFINEMIREYEEEPGQADDIYQLGVQFFGLTK